VEFFRSNGKRGIYPIVYGSVVLDIASSDSSKMIDNIRKLRKQKTKIDFWTKEEFEKYFREFTGTATFISLVFLFMTGMRIGEGSAIQQSDIDFETGILKIEKNLYYKNLNNYRFVETKTKASERHIVLDSDTLKLLQEWKEVQQAVVKTDFVMSYNGHPHRSTPCHTQSQDIQIWQVYTG